MNSKLLSFVFVFTLISSLSSAEAKIEAVIGETPLENNRNLPGFIPETATNEIVVSREQYVLSYQKEKRSPLWVAWNVESSDLGSSGRSNNFNQDSDLENYLASNHPSFHAVEEFEYKGSCFDRGHQVPSADRTYDRSNNEKTFLMSNMLPQTAFLNRGIWEHLESYTRGLVKNNQKKVYIISGPIYDEDFGSIGLKKDIPIPSHNFKIIFVLNPNQSTQDIDVRTEKIVVIMPNRLQSGAKPLDNLRELCGTFKPTTPVDPMDWKKYQTTLSVVEKMSGLSFKFARP